MIVTPTCYHQFDRLGGRCRHCGCAQREIVLGPYDDAPNIEKINKQVKHILKGTKMHYRNGREAKNGDTVIQIGEQYVDGKPVGGFVKAVGVLYNATPGNDYCNGSLAPIQNIQTGACMCDCLHIDDVAEILKAKELDKRPAGK